MACERQIAVVAIILTNAPNILIVVILALCHEKWWM